MEKITLSVSDICGDNIYTRDDAKPLFVKIGEALQHGAGTIVDFENREIASESFLDEAIVEHYIHPIVSEATTRVILKNVSRSDQMLLKRIYDYRKRIEQSQKAKLVKDSESKGNQG